MSQQQREYKRLVYAGERWLIVLGNLPDVDHHRHPIPSCCFGLDEPLNIREPETGEARRYWNLLVPPEAQGPVIRANRRPMAFAFLSAEHPAYYACLGQQPARLIPDGVPCAEEMGALMREIYDRAPAFSHVQERFEAILARAPGREPDPRIAQALAALRAEDAGNLSLEHVARRVCLSPSRLVHLFKEETGATFRRQRLWIRVIQSTTLATRTQSLTDIASAAGFSDLAHYSRTFRRVFGVKPTSVVRFDGSLQVRTARYEHRLGTPRHRGADSAPRPDGGRRGERETPPDRRAAVR
ncbi:helix-turn-helix domain-containing protein [Ectothiorhodospiraceae bacterium WFHF3C12]|nr:helix-turn-helix domain-containing protein [Ectothiorhodospiraceae bacterium WFHF3C12]